jgi:hypothetical protein
MHISSVSVAAGATAGEVWTYPDRTLTGLAGVPRSDVIGADEPLYTYYSTARAQKLDYLDASVASRARPADILSDGTPFPGSFIDMHISSVAVAAGATAGEIWTYPTRTLTGFTGGPRSDLIGADEALYTYYSTARAQKLDYLDASISTRAKPADILSDLTAFPGANIDAAISSRATAGQVWVSPTRTLTGLTGTPRSDLIGADEPLYTYYSTARAQKLDFLDALISSRAAPSDVPSVTYYTTTRGAKLDYLDASVSIAGLGRFSDESGSFVWQAATYGTAETDISALFTTPLTGTTRRRYAVYLDMTGPAADATAWATCTIRIKLKIDGANARSIDKKDFAKTDWAAEAEPGVPIDIPMVAQDVQITMQFLYSLAANATIYYHWVRESLE